MILCYRIINNQVAVINDVFGENCKSTIFYLESIVNYYQYISGYNLSLSIYLFDDIPAMSISQKGNIYFRSALVKMKDVAMYLYFPHEIFHQLIGNEVTFTGNGKLWMLESFTEYLQLRYIRFMNKKLFYKQTYYFLKRYKENILNDAPIVDINEQSPEIQIITAIESRGVLLFLMYFKNIDDNLLRKMLVKLANIKRITITRFFKVCDEIGVDAEKLCCEISDIGNYNHIKNEINEVMRI